jgi:hypothetical protein
VLISPAPEGRSVQEVTRSRKEPRAVWVLPSQHAAARDFVRIRAFALTSQILAVV